MTSKPSKAERKEDRVQQLEKELAETRKKLSASSKTVQLDDEQIDAFLDKLTDRIEWSTNRIVDDTNTTPIIIKEPKKEDAFSIVLKSVLSVLFCGFGIVIIIAIIRNWSTYWIGGANNLATLCVLFVGLICFAIGVDIFKEKDRNYLVSLFSALVALVALIVSLIK